MGENKSKMLNQNISHHIVTSQYLAEPIQYQDINLHELANDK